MQPTQTRIEIQTRVQAGESFGADGNAHRLMLAIQRAEPGNASLTDFTLAIVENGVNVAEATALLSVPYALEPPTQVRS